MSFRNAALILFVQLALCSNALWAGENGSMSFASTQEEAEPAEVAAPALVAAPAVVEPAVVEPAVVEPAVAAAAPAAEPTAEAPAAATAVAAAEPAADEPAAAEPAAVEPAAASPVVTTVSVASAAPDQVPWWRDAISLIGLAPDPRPGEVAEPAAGRPAQAADYVIGAGDQLGISVWRDENLTRTIVVLPDGKISFPLVGELVAKGKTVAQLKHELEGKLVRYVSDAGVTVEVKQSSSMLIYIIGRVNAPGRQTLFAPTNVLQALAMAGGLNPFARKSEVRVFRQQEGKTVSFPFDYQQVSEGRHLETNIELQRGDVVIVP